MASLLNKAIEKLPGTGSPSTSNSSSPVRGSERKSVSDRVIPPEPVQLAANPDLSRAQTEAPLQLHNLARANRRSKKLEWDEDLARAAQGHAETLAKTGILEHSGVGAEGENLYVGGQDATYEDAIDSWLNEEKKYHGEAIGEGNLSDWQHFCKYIVHRVDSLARAFADSRTV